MMQLILSIGVSVALIAVTVIYMYAFRVQSKPDEWMLVIRNGKVVKSGVGITWTKRWDDQIVKFPSKIHSLKFKAQQITIEK